MNWIDSIKEINKARTNNRLVIFVGSGVSNNSGVPTWKGLIETIAKKINYNENCNGCDSIETSCPKEDCSERFNFTAAEFLRIPEYYYQSASSDEYFQTISDTLKCDKESNAVDEIILDIAPHHIITTNYDILPSCTQARIVKGTNGKTCRDIGAHKKYEEKCKSDPVWLAYNRAYKAHYARLLKKKMTKSEFLTWSIWAADYRNTALAGKVRIEEYEKKIKE